MQTSAKVQLFAEPWLPLRTLRVAPCLGSCQLARSTALKKRRGWLITASSHSDSDEPQPDPDANALNDWRTFRAHLVALEKANSALTAELSSNTVPQPVWVHELTLPEKGCLLLGRLRGMGQFTHAVVLLCEHDSLGSSGFIINMSLPQQLLDLSTELEVADALRHKQVYYGGPCSRGNANVLHACSEVQGAIQIVEALYLGGLEDINRLSGLGRLQAEQTQILVGCAAWTPGQLHNEVWAGCWHVLAASSNFLHDCVFGQHMCSQAEQKHEMWIKILAQAGIDPDAMHRD